MLQVLRKYHDARDRNMLLVLPFVSISDYLHELRSIARLMRPLGPRGLLYLAAAVSDFFVPVSSLVNLCVRLVALLTWPPSRTAWQSTRSRVQTLSTRKPSPA